MRQLLAQLPAVHVLADAAAAASPGAAPRWALVEAARRAIAERRAALVAGAEAGGDAASGAAIDAAAVAARAAELARPALRRVINATGVALHTNLGRAPLAEAARRAIDEVARGYSNLEYDLDRGERGSRHDHLRGLLRELTGAEDALVVNNNAAATVLGLAALAAGREVVVSRGELIEIGGSFRLPEILALSGGTLVEVGTTNKTHRRDYEAAIRPATGLLLKVHRSNFAIVGFTSEVLAEELVALGRARGVATMIDLGSGALADRESQRAWGLPAEPTVAETVATGADLVTFSGDKLLGGPQAGIAVGTRAAIAAARAHPLMRALRPDKLTLAALAATLACYRDGELARVPVLRALGAPAAALRAAADRLAAAIGAVPGITVAVEPCRSTVGGGAMPTAELPSWAVTLRAEGGGSADALDRGLRVAAVPVVGRIEDGRVWLDVRTIDTGDTDVSGDTDGASTGGVADVSGDTGELAEVAAAVRALGRA
jgi:L-seryl-tRNA(Ser) seleniumtransferase